MVDLSYVNITNKFDFAKYKTYLFSKSLIVNQLKQPTRALMRSSILYGNSVPPKLQYVIGRSTHARDYPSRKSLSYCMSKYNQLLSGAKVTPCTKQQQPRNCLIVSELNPDPVTG